MGLKLVKGDHLMCPEKKVTHHLTQMNKSMMFQHLKSFNFWLSLRQWTIMWSVPPYCGQKLKDKYHRRTVWLQNVIESEPSNGFWFCRLYYTLNKRMAAMKVNRKTIRRVTISPYLRSGVRSDVCIQFSWRYELLAAIRLWTNECLDSQMPFLVVPQHNLILELLSTRIVIACVWRECWMGQQMTL